MPNSQQRQMFREGEDYAKTGVIKSGEGCCALSRGSSQPSDRTQVSHIAGGLFTILATTEAQEYWSG